LTMLSSLERGRYVETKCPSGSWGGRGLRCRQKNKTDEEEKKRKKPVAEARKKASLVPT